MHASVYFPPNQALSYVSRRRLDDDDFDPDAVDEDGLPLVYNEERIAAFWKDKPGELAGRWVLCTRAWAGLTAGVAKHLQSPGCVLQAAVAAEEHFACRCSILSTFWNLHSTRGSGMPAVRRPHAAGLSLQLSLGHGARAPVVCKVVKNFSPRPLQMPGTD